MSTILIGGYYGAGNLGDEAILECMLADMRAQERNLQFIVTSWDAQRTSRQYDVESFHWSDIASLFDAVKRSDLVILGGGGLFQDYWGLDPRSYLRSSYWDITAYGSLPLLAKLNGIPAMIYAVGLGPLSSSMALQHTRMAFENCQLATVRDADSLVLLEKSGFDLHAKKTPRVRVLADPVFSLQTTDKDDQEAKEYLESMNLAGKRDILGIALRYWDFSVSQDNWTTRLVKCLKVFLERHPSFHLLLIPFQCNPQNPYTDDLEVNRGLSNLISSNGRVHEIAECLSPRLTQALIKQCTVLLGMRLHSLIMGINAGTPVIGLPYDPKVRILMKDASLEKYCVSSLDFDPDEILQKLDSLVSRKDREQKKLNTFRTRTAGEARENAELAISLVRSSSRSTPSFLHQFSLDQAGIILEQDRQLEEHAKQMAAINRLVCDLTSVPSLQSGSIESIVGGIRELDQRNKTLTESVAHEQQDKFILLEQVKLLEDGNRSLDRQSKEQAREILTLEGQTARLQNKVLQQTRQKSKLTQKHEALNQRLEILGQKVEALYSSLEIRSGENLNLVEQLNAIYRSRAWKLVKQYYNAINSTPLGVIRRTIAGGSRTSVGGSEIIARENPLVGDRDDLSSNEMLHRVITQLNSRRLKGVFIITSAFPFNRSINQRVVNLAAYLGRNGWGVVYVAWRWSKEEHLPNVGKEVYRNIFQIPVDLFLENTERFGSLEYEKKHLVLEFPHPGFLQAAFQLKKHRVSIIYEIIDEWEAFSWVGQAPWYEKTTEEGIVLNSDHLTAVSLPLVDKFRHLRRDIALIPNGYDARLLGSNHRNISKKHIDPTGLKIGYFGHLTESWFDWDLLFDVIDLTRQQNEKVEFHIIGDGLSEAMINKIAKYSGTIRLEGRVPPTGLFRHAREWDLAMIPFKSGRLSEAVDPIKIYEYFYFGLPVIVTGIKHLEQYPNVRVVSNPKMFLEAARLLQASQKPVSTRFTTGWLSGFSRWVGTRAGDPLAGQTAALLKEASWEGRFSKLLGTMESREWIF